METIMCNREISGEYVRAGETYKVTREGRHLHLEGPNGNTFMRDWSYAAALRTGQLVVLS